MTEGGAESHTGTDHDRTPPSRDGILMSPEMQKAPTDTRASWSVEGILAKGGLKNLPADRCGKPPGRLAEEPQGEQTEEPQGGRAEAPPGRGKPPDQDVVTPLDHTMEKPPDQDDFYIPSNFNYVVEAVKDVAGFDEDKNIYKTPSLALKLGHSLKKIADILTCEAQMAGSDGEGFLKNVQKSHSLYEKKWDVCVSSRALQTLREAKWNTPHLVPFTEDVKAMHVHLDKCREEYKKTFENDPNKKNWSKLATLSLCEVILFNRRREGEVSKMPLSAFTLRDTSGVHSDLAEGHSPLEQKLCQHFQHIEIRAKRNRKVPILLTPDMLSSMEVLVAHRRTCGIPDENSFFFSRPEAETHLRGSDAIRQIAKECGAKHPETLSSTKLRKQIASLLTVLNLKDHEMDILANFFGHDIRVHRQYYRLPEGTLELAKVSKVLCVLEQGQLSDFKGMSLDQI
ncbi:uncharacterized protein LOC115439448 [Sphaeramia orbicularis]|uniref:uncharacterized protein LOC115439448 n=1 Tax=Sphaeramia orbicularis TaxID=375764 RepID=UPI00117E3031|nr:uncharacterized protein LOC115439448 [Sphaeramia orbicularis]